MTWDMTDNQLAAHALDMWANYVETGEVSLSAKDAAERKLHFNALTLEQMKGVVRLRDLANEIRKQDT